jgi:hypothetical protein
MNLGKAKNGFCVDRSATRKLRLRLGSDAEGLLEANRMVCDGTVTHHLK